MSDKLQNADEAWVETAKLTDYLLSTTHPDGKGKAKFFMQFGFAASLPEQLEASLRRHERTQPVVEVKTTVHGVKSNGSLPMNKKKPTSVTHAKKKAEASLVRSSAAEYLTFVAAGGDSENSSEMRYVNENIWLTQKLMAALYDVSVPAISQHLMRPFSDNELEPEATIKKYLITQTEGKTGLTVRLESITFIP